MLWWCCRGGYREELVSLRNYVTLACSLLPLNPPYQQEPIFVGVFSSSEEGEVSVSAHFSPPARERCC